MIHVQFPKSSEQIRPSDLPPLVKYGQGRGGEHESGPLETVQTISDKLRAAGYKEPEIKTVSGPLERPDQGCEEEFRHLEGRIRRETDSEMSLPVVSRAGFRAGVLSACAGGTIYGGIFLTWGLLPALIFAAVCVGFVSGMILTKEWK